MIIAYIHGFCSSSKAKKAQIMKAELLKNYKDIKFVSLDFSDNFKIAMEELNEQILSLLKEDPKVCLAASSLGGFMAMLLSIKYDLKVATVTNVKPLGSGDRVCVDTTDMMKPGEGMLIGSYSKSLFLVHSESLESEYVASRPFRVNAGPVQAYVMVPGNKTRYLSELVAGDEVLIVNTKGETRTAYVGRSKIERRPLILIEAEYEGKTIRTLLQNAETIRIVDAEDNPLSVADIKVGDKVKVYVESNARHFGIAIDETIIEQ